MIVLDSSAACEMARQTEEGLAFCALMLSDEKVISCDLLRAEAISVFRKFCRRGLITAEKAQQYFAQTLSFVDKFYPMEDFQEEALAESIRLNHSSYDMFYFILARRYAATLFTLDRKLIRLCEEHGVQCVYILENGEF